MNKKILIIGIIVCVVIIGISIFFLLKFESELQKICEEKSWPSDCSLTPNLIGRKMCEKCKELGIEGKKPETVEPPGLTQITSFEGEGMTADPDFSPDASQIVFGREGGLYIINSDGTGLTKIGIDDLWDPSWSPVNNRILFNKGGGNHELYIIDLDKDKTEMIPLGAEYAWLPAWSSDGKKITYTVYDESNAPVSLWDFKCDGTGILSSIWLMNSDGTGKTQLTTEEDGYCSQSSFSPDGSKIAYNKGFVNPREPSLTLTKASANEIWIMNSDGSNKHAIYIPEEGVHFLQQDAWSKNNEIVFMKIGYQRAPQIWVINSDGTNPRCIINPEEKGMPTLFYHDSSWDHTGTKILTIKEGSLPKEPDYETSTRVYLNSNVVTFPWEE